MTPSHEQAHAFVALWEGIISTDPLDPGGLTVLGIARRRHGNNPKLAEFWARVDYLIQVYGLDTDGTPSPELIEAIRKDAELKRMSLAFYRAEYWMPLHCNEMPQGLALAVYGTAVNCGIRRATKWLQAALGVKIDGALGPKTLAALRERIGAGRGLDIASMFLAARSEHYEMLNLKTKWAKRFIKGWRNRMRDLMRVVFQEFENATARGE